MRKVGGMWVLDDEAYFDGFFIATYDRYQPEPVEAAMQHVAHTRTFLDGGAHYGTVSRLVRHRFARVLAFEPNPAVFECLVLNTAAFTNIEPKPKALGDRVEAVSVGLAPEALAFRGSQDEWIHCNSGCIQVLGPGSIAMTTIDSLGLDDLDFLKLDIEGMEYAALKGAEATLRRSWPVVLIEDKGHGARYGLKGGECAKFLASLGYVCVYKGAFGDFAYVKPR